MLVLYLGAATFALLVVSGIVYSLASVFTVSDPANSVRSGLYADSAAFYLGKIPYADPSGSYFGMLYTPLMPALIGALYHVQYWHGWGHILAFASALSLIWLVVWVGIRSAGSEELKGRAFVDRLPQLCGVVFFATFTWWLISGIQRAVFIASGGAGGIFMFWAVSGDLLAWGLAFNGLFLVARSQNSERRLILGGLLIYASFWAKQTTLPIFLAAAALLILQSAYGFRRGRPVFLFCALLASLHAATFLALNLVSDGWAAFFLFWLPHKHLLSEGLLTATHAFLLGLLPGSLVLLGVLVVTVWSRRSAVGPKKRPGWLRASNKATGAVRGLRFYLSRALKDSPFRVGLLLFLVLEFVFAPYFYRKIGSQYYNHFLGAHYAVLLIAATFYGSLQTVRKGRIASLAVCLAILSVYLLPSLQRWAEKQGVLLNPHALQVVKWLDVPTRLQESVRGKRLYSPGWPDIGAPQSRSLVPSWSATADLVAAGLQPRGLVDQLLNAEFDYALPQPNTLLAEIYIQGFGNDERILSNEANYFWKLNRVLYSRYKRNSGIVVDPEESDYASDYSFLGRRPASERRRFSWQRHCFAPFDIGLNRFVIRRGGGFWCRSSANGTAVQLRQTPPDVPWSELRLDREIERLAGSIEITSSSTPGAYWELSLGPNVDLVDDVAKTISLRVEPDARRPGYVSLGVRARKRALDRQVFPAKRVGGKYSMTVLLSSWEGGFPAFRPIEPGVGVLALPKLARGTELSLNASARSRARFELANLTAK